MKKITQWQNHVPTHDGCVVTIGNFDGFHIGHQALIRHIKSSAFSMGLASALLSFTPHPRRFFNVNQDTFQLVSSNHTDRLLEAFGVDYHYYLTFDKAFSKLSALDFIEKILVQAMNVKKIIVGADFRFGNNREGDVTFLKQVSSKYGYDVEILNPIRDEHNYVVSSTIIREALHEGDLERANHLLGWPHDSKWEMEGTIIHGDKRGREIGYPTANIDTGAYIHPKFGVYAVRIALNDDCLIPQWRPAVANFGIRPMFEVQTPLLEVYIFDFDQDIYEQNMRVQFISYLRGEKNFPDIETLTKQIDQDCLDAKECLNSCG